MLVRQCTHLFHGLGPHFALSVFRVPDVEVGSEEAFVGVIPERQEGLSCMTLQRYSEPEPWMINLSLV